MKIAVYHNLPSGGGKRALYELTRRLAQRHEVDVYTLATADHEFCDLRPHCRRHVVFPFRPLPLARRPFGRLNQGIRTLDLLRLDALQRRVAAEIDRGGYHVAFVHNCQFSQGPAVLRFLGTPSVYYCQEPPRHIYEPPVDRPYLRLSRIQRLVNCVDPFPGIYRKVLGALDRGSARSARIVLVNSAYSRETLYRTYGIFARVCYLGVDTGHFRPLGLPKEDLLLSVGAINSRKGFDFLIHSLSRIDASHRPRLVLVSNYADEREQRYLAELAASLPVQVEFRYRIDAEQLRALYNRARLTVYAPVMEPFGLVPLESMACGTPVVGVREAGVRETICHEETGLLVERDVVAFAAAVMRLLGDQALMNRLSAQCVAHVRANWTWGRAAIEAEAILDSAARTASGTV